MELRHLRYFVAVAEELHFGRAAHRVSIAQPALTKQIQVLEAELGVRLLNRTKRQVELTAAGRRLLADARPLLEQARQAELAATRAGRGELGRLSVGFTPVALYGVLPPILRAYCDRLPDVELALHECWTPDLVQRIAEQRIDVGFVRLPIAADLAVRPLRRDPLVAVLPACHPLADRPAVALTDLAADRFVLFPRHFRPDYYDEIVRLCRDAGFSPRLGQEAMTEPTMIGLVAAGLGVTLAPAAYHALQRPEVVYRPLRDCAPAIETALAWRRADPAPTLHAFLAIAREIADGWAAAPLADGRSANA